MTLTVNNEPFEPEYIGREVVIRNTMLYNGKLGVLEKTSGNPEDFWDYNVRLEDGTLIGVVVSQVSLL